MSKNTKRHTNITNPVKNGWKISGSLGLTIVAITSTIAITATNPKNGIK